jgi:hypothetical protein
MRRAHCARSSSWLPRYAHTLSTARRDWTRSLTHRSSYFLPNPQHQAGFAVLGRSMVLFLACYLPSLLTIAARLLHWGAPNPDSALLALLFVAGTAGPSFLQGLVLLRVRERHP